MRLSILQQMYLNQTELYRSSFSFYYIQIKDELSIQPHSQVIHFQHFNGKKEGITIGKNQLNRSHDIVIDYANTLYIADSYNNRIQKYTRDASDGITVAGQRNGAASASSSHLFYPTRVRANENGDIYVADTNNHRIQFWRSGDSFGTTLAGNSLGIAGSANNYLRNPYGITYDSSKTLYISDSSNSRLMSYVFNASTGTVLAGSGAVLSNASVSVPYGLTYHAISNSLLISNLNTHNIVQIMLDDYSWKIIGGSTQLSSPSDVTYDPMGNIYVADTGNGRIQLFLNGKSNGTTIASSFAAPVSVKLDNQLNLYVADFDNSRIQKFVRY